MVGCDPEGPGAGRAKGRPKGRTEARFKDRRRIDTGRRGEDLAAAHLERAGYVLLERNYRCLFGEIDIIARDGDTLCFIEVKSRRSGRYGDPQLAVTPRKQARMIRAALQYLGSHGLADPPARFDVAAVRLSPEGPETVELIRNAFELNP